MADDVTLPGTGAVVATDEVSSRHYQLVKAAFGADGSATLVATDAGMPTQSGYKEVSGSATANNTDLTSTDVSGYRWVSVQLTGTWTSSVGFQHSNDGTTWVSTYLRNAFDYSAVPSASVAANGVYSGALNARYFRVRTVGATTGTVSAVVGFSANPSLPAAVTAYISNASALSVSLSGTALVTPTPGTTGGWSVSSTTALSTTKVVVKASAGTFGGYMIYNPNTVETHVQVFNVASGSVTLGSTTPTYVLTIPAQSAANLELTCGINHSTAITIAATTTATGSSAPTTGLQATIFYK